MARRQGSGPARTRAAATVCLLLVFCAASEEALHSEEYVRAKMAQASFTDNPEIPGIVRSASEPLPDSIVPEDATILTSENLPSNKKFLPEVGNGHIATVVQSDAIFMNGLYNGANFSSHRARIPSSNAYSIAATLPSQLRRSYSLDVGRAIFSEKYEGDVATITLRTYAHRLYRGTLVTELVMSRGDRTSEVGALISLNFGDASEDVVFSEIADGLKIGVTKEAEYPDIASVTEFYVKVSPPLGGIIRLSPDNQTQTFLALTVIDVLREDVEEQYTLALKAFQEGTLLASHVEEWNKAWIKGRIDVEGDTSVAKLSYTSLYYTLSSLPFDGDRENWPFIGLSPGGLAHGSKGKDYNGHVFWDQDTWMFPPIALLYPDLGRLIVETRARTLGTARKNAQITGWQGARYPWESAFTGLETCPSADTREHEVHINGDIPLMVRQYWQLTRDTDLMINGSGADIVWATANFWSSRVTSDSERNIYDILDVTPPDEWHSPVNNSAYTNHIAAINLQFANQLATEFGKPVNSTWNEVRSKMYLPFDSEMNYHPEFEDFDISEEVKQADVVLLGFPLMVSMNASTRGRDLSIYEKLTPIGNTPAMTWAMFVLGWLEMDNDTKAAELFARSALNAQQPFLVWSENADGSGATNFITGMGGYLQSVLFGYGGIRLHDNMMIFNPKLIPGTTKVKFTGINYRRCSFDLIYSTDLMTLSLTSIEPGHRSLDVLFEERENWEQMIVGQDIDMKRQYFTIRSSQ